MWVEVFDTFSSALIHLENDGFEVSPIIELGEEKAATVGNLYFVRKSCRSVMCAQMNKFGRQWMVNIKDKEKPQ